jgi:transcriptional regulator with XRE-family HTH domain
MAADDEEEDSQELAQAMLMISERIQAARKKRDMGRGELGERAGMTQQRVFALEHGVGNVTVKTLVRLAKILDVDVGFFFTPENSDPLERLRDSLDRLRIKIEDYEAFEAERKAEITKLLADVERVTQGKAPSPPKTKTGK